jgi:hypothetical protein
VDAHVSVSCTRWQRLPELRDESERVARAIAALEDVQRAVEELAAVVLEQLLHLTVAAAGRRPITLDPTGNAAFDAAFDANLVQVPYANLRRSWGRACSRPARVP